MPEPIQVTVRKLPNGDVLPGQEVSRQGRVIEIELSDGPSPLRCGAAVEIMSEEKIYLGEIQATSGAKMKISVEHVVDRAKIAAIQAVWGEPEISS